MKFKNGDIVRVISKNEECLILTKGLDLETNKNKYVVYSSNGKDMFIVTEEDMLFVDTLEDELEEALNDRSTGEA